MNYVQEQWQMHAERELHHGKVVRVLAWTASIIAALAIAAYVSERYWYPYLQQYF